MPMRDRLARLVQRNPERPTLRQRAAALKASAAKVLRKPARPDGAAGEKPARTPTPPFSPEAEVSLAHMVVDFFGNEDIHPALNCDIALRDRARAILAAAAAPDPIFSAIAENRRLFDAWTEATKLPLVGIDPAPETDAAQDAFYAHCDDVLVQTVPQTAAGCAVLARYAHEFATREGFTLDNQNKDATDHLRILNLIAQSPMHTAPPAPSQPVPSRDTELLALGHRFEAAAADELVACAKANAAEAEARPDLQRIAETDAAANDAGDIAADLAHKIAGIPAHTADGLRLKLRALIHYNAAAFADPPDMPDPDQVLAHSLRMDAARLGLAPCVSADAEAQIIADAIEKLWSEWSALAERDYGDYSPEAEQRCDAMFERRMALIEAAEALPASSSREVRYAKALAFAWYEHVGLWTHRKPLLEYGLDGRLVLDIEASLTGAPAWTGAEEPVRGRPVVNLAVKAPAQADAADAKPAPDPIKRDTDRPNLSKLSIVQLRNLYERYVQISDVWNDALHAPWTNYADGAGLRASNAAGNLIEAEQTRICNLYAAVVAEISSRSPSDEGFEANWRLETLIRHELMCNGDLREAPDLRAAIAERWSA